MQNINKLEEHVSDVNSELQEEAAKNEREVDELLTLNELRKSRRETREPNWLKDYYREVFTNQLQQGQNQVNGLQGRDEQHNYRYNEFVPKTKLTFPRFGSGEPTEWLYKVNKFFEYHRTPETHKLSLATLHLDGAASIWYQWMETNHLVHTWPEFEMQIRIQFGPSPYEDPNTQLKKLKQTGTITDYKVKFQYLTNRIHGLPESFLKGCYIGGLRHDIQCEVIASQPYNLQQAIEGCEEILTLNDANNVDELADEIGNETEQGSLYALIGNSKSKCLRMDGKIDNKFVQILVDGGSSHNFIQTRVAKFMGLTITPSTQLFVIVGNGQNLKCVGQCADVKFTIQGHQFKSDFYVIDLHGADLVLGVAWQESLGKLELIFTSLI
ncbi:hypothetical protein AgCh_027901 [Apium graveolens]